MASAWAVVVWPTPPFPLMMVVMRGVRFLWFSYGTFLSVWVDFARGFLMVLDHHFDRCFDPSFYEISANLEPRFKPLASINNPKMSTK